MLSDTLFEAICEIERYEQQYPKIYSRRADQLRKIKVEMRLLQLHYDLPPPVAKHYTSEDYDWLRKESLKRAKTQPPHKFSVVMDECIAELGMKNKKYWRPPSVNESN